jgi:hypothetical protein
MLTKLQATWQAEESELGKFFKYIIGYLGILSGIIGEVSSNYLPLFPGLVPEWLSHWLVIVGVIGYIVGKLTKA